MGASQSTESNQEYNNTNTDNNTNSSNNNIPLGRPSLSDQMDHSLYDILGVESNATDVELKKAYKKQALLLHPDRNFDRIEEATTKFAKVQAAYDILSDPQERAWYDSHGSESGRNGGGDEPEYGGKITRQEELERYLDPTLYMNASSQPEEFYDLIGRLFQQLAEEEHEAALDAANNSGNNDIDINKLPHLPSFGSGKSSWTTEVKPFYDAWSSFSSIKSFVWENIYRSWDAPDRRSRRAMEIRNKKIQDAARNEFNVTVRNLIKLIKQKDPRVKAHNKKVSKKPDDANSKEQAKRDRQAHAERKKQQVYEEQEWEKVGAQDNLDNVIAGDQVDDDDDDEEDLFDLFECVVCDKLFKTKKQLSVHELSKKHIKNLRHLQREMRREGVELGFDNDDSSEDEDGDEDEVEEGEQAKIEVDDVNEENEKNNKIPASNSENNKTSTYNSVPDNRKKEKYNDSDDDGSDNGDEERKSETEIRVETTNAVKGDPTLEDLLAQLEDSRVSSRSPTPKPSSSSSKGGKAKQRRQKKEQAQTEFANKCSVCQTVFASRNKLFDHVKISGHASAPRR